MDLWSNAPSVQVQAADRQAERQTGEQRERHVNKERERQVNRQVNTPECMDAVNGSRHVLLVVDVCSFRMEDLTITTCD